MLKKKYRDGNVSTDSGASKDSSRHEVHHDFKTPMPKAPPRKVHKGAARWEEGQEEEEQGATAPPPRCATFFVSKFQFLT